MTTHRRLNKVGFMVAKVAAGIGGIIAGAVLGAVAFPLYGIMTRHKEIERKRALYRKEHPQGPSMREEACCNPLETVVMTAFGPILGAALGGGMAVELVEKLEDKQIIKYKNNQRFKTDHHHGFFCSHRREPVEADGRHDNHHSMKPC